MKKNRTINSDIAEVMALDSVRHSKKQFLSLDEDTGTLVVDRVDGNESSELMGFEMFHPGELVEAIRYKHIEDREEHKGARIHTASWNARPTVYVRSQGRPVVDKRDGRIPSRDVPEWGTDNSAVTQLLAYKYPKLAYQARMSKLLQAVRTYWWEPREGGTPDGPRKALDRFRGEGNDLLVHGQADWRLDEEAFRHKWKKMVSEGELSEIDQQLVDSPLLRDIWNSPSDWGIVEGAWVILVQFLLWEDE